LAQSSLAFVEFATFPNISRLRTQNPVTTSMIDYRISEAKAEGEEPKKYQIWMPIEQISPHLQRAVLAGEDSRFFDTTVLIGMQSIKLGKKRRGKERRSEQEGDYDPNSWIPPMPNFKRGASTITQQLSKNLYLSEERSFCER
jgi:monofunctional biosynthetic peptidoglycan transglycosylase